MTFPYRSRWPTIQRPCLVCAHGCATACRGFARTFPPALSRTPKIGAFRTATCQSLFASRVSPRQRPVPRFAVRRRQQQRNRSPTSWTTLKSSMRFRCRPRRARGGRRSRPRWKSPTTRSWRLKSTASTCGRRRRSTRKPCAPCARRRRSAARWSSTPCRRRPARPAATVTGARARCACSTCDRGWKNS